jgi:quercetin dioxygenase-like cupin family protein
MMKIARIWADAAGESHYQDLEVEVAPSGPIGRVSELLPVTGMMLRENEPGYDFDWHVAPRRQYIVMLEGLVEIQVSDGETRTFAPGEIILVEDLTGKGHKSRSPDGKARRSIFLPLP